MCSRWTTYPWLMLEPGAADPEWLNELANALEAPDEGSQCNSPGSHEGPAGSLNDCAKTKDVHPKPKAGVIDIQQVEDHLLEVEVGKEDLEWLDVHADTLEMPDNKRDLPDTTSEHAKTKTGHTEPETEVVDTWQVVDVLPMVGVRIADLEQQDKCMSTPEPPEKTSQHASNKIKESQDLPKSSSETV
ncbi:hypothetical protein EDD16DRAFT_1520817 [Pisolithus croceorrhizus]|nr:hypothetical protein EDD16DRAFT_1520817 [Pisolithus croceorrhizus]KAI6117204.1 hypothetical protein EV401DRAFT_1889070 [Pisolithus croceorrhizus]KAI6161725.1 hypothetical protein EDD17DRAFT_1508829 [Pisolithus thermaeus]